MWIFEKSIYGNRVSANRGCSIEDDLAVCGTHLWIPAFTRGKSQLSQQEIKATRHLARVRIHVERIVGQLRKQDTIIKKKYPYDCFVMSSTR